MVVIPWPGHSYQKVLTREGRRHRVELIEEGSFVCVKTESGVEGYAWLSIQLTKLLVFRIDCVNIEQSDERIDDWISVAFHQTTPQTDWMTIFLFIETDKMRVSLATKVFFSPLNSFLFQLWTPLFDLLLFDDFRGVRLANESFRVRQSPF